MKTTQTFALIDNNSGFIWWTGAAASPEAACAAATLDYGMDVVQYEHAYSLASNEGGYHVHAAPAGFAVIDGQNAEAINTVSAMPLIGKYRAITAS